MTASNPLDTEPTGRSAIPVPPGAHPVASGASAAAAAHLDPPEPVEAPVQWVEMAAGMAVQREQVATLPARRPIELDLIGRREDDEAEAEARAFAADEPGHLYRTAYATVMAVVVAFCVSGSGMAVWVILRH